jgi:RNA recognition motif-containing protein
MSDHNPDDITGKLFVGGVSFKTTDEEFTEFFKGFHGFKQASLMKDKHGEPRGFGFVVFETNEIAEEFCRVHNGTEKLVLHDRGIDFKQAQPRTETKSYKRHYDDKHRITPYDPAWGKGPAKIFIGGIPYEYSSADLKEFFGKYGPVQEAEVMVDSLNGKSRGFAFLTFESWDSLKACCDASPHNMNNRLVDCRAAVPRTPSGDGHDAPPARDGRDRARRGGRGGSRNEFDERDRGYSGRGPAPGWGRDEYDRGYRERDMYDYRDGPPRGGGYSMAPPRGGYSDFREPAPGYGSRGRAYDRGYDRGYERGFDRDRGYDDYPRRQPDYDQPYDRRSYGRPYPDEPYGGSRYPSAAMGASGYSSSKSMDSRGPPPSAPPSGYAYPAQGYREAQRDAPPEGMYVPHAEPAYAVVGNPAQQGPPPVSSGFAYSQQPSYTQPSYSMAGGNPGQGQVPLQSAYAFTPMNHHGGMMQQPATGNGYPGSG